MKSETEKKVLKFIEKRSLLTAGSTVCIGFSGGADSTALLLMMYCLKNQLDIEVTAVHINHCLRREESVRDELFCREMCRKYGIPIEVYKVDVKEEVKKTGKSTEEAARDLRYEIFRSFPLAATAHTASDNIETSVYNLMRGSGIAGIAGIPPKRDNIIRPILCLTREETENYVHECGESFVTDSTNLSDDYSRNRIRHQLIPLMHSWNASLEKTFINSSDVLRTELDFIESESEKAYLESIDESGRKLHNISEYHAAVRQRCISKLLKANNISYNFQRVREIDESISENKKINLTNDIYAVCRSGGVSIEKIVPFDSNYIEKELHIGENNIFSGKIITISCKNNENKVKSAIVNKKLTNYALDYDKIVGRLILRSRKSGDRIMPAGRDFHVSVKKWLQSSVDREKRPYIHFIEDECGLIFVEGLGPDRRVAPDENTKMILEIKIEEDRPFLKA